MAGQRQADEQESIGKTVKRRGLMAAAAAMVAGIVAKQASVPVAANDAIWQFPYAGIASSPRLFAVTNTSTGDSSTAIFANAAGRNGSAIYGGVSGFGATGVYGTTNSASATGVGGFSTSYYGVSGTSTSGTGVYGESSGNSLSKGVHGKHTASGYAVYGEATATGGYGVTGVSGNAFGVLGQSASGAGVQGEITGGSAANTIAVKGVNSSTGAGGIGVYGQCAAVGGYGVVGATDNPSSIGVGGMASADGSSAFSGGTANPNAYAGYFQGHVVVAGSFDVSPLGNKHGVAPHPDGSHRTFYSVESPECWVEDFGTGTLAGGKAEVALDADFAALTHTDDYHVFITEHGGTHHHLSVATKTGVGFTVEADHELAKVKGKNGSDLAGTFSYRVVAKPKTTAKVERLAKATLPTLLLPPMPKDEPPRPTKEP